MSNAILWIIVMLTILYAGLLLAYRFWFCKLTFFDAVKEFDLVSDDYTLFTIVIPARNEAANIKACILSIVEQNYPARFVEIIVINDFSEDDTEQIVQEMISNHKQVHLLNLSDYYKQDEISSFKKKAIETAVLHAKGDWITTTDADCIAPPQWLSLYHQFIKQKNPVFVAAPVMFVDAPGVLNTFQVLDFLALQGITAAAVSAGHHAMSNGANLAFEKLAFNAVGAYQGVDALASGDDMFLMHKMKKVFPHRIGYLFHPGAIVLSKTMSTWKEFLMQRIRWSSKARYYDDQSIFWVLLLVYLYNFSLLLLLFMGRFELLLISLAVKTLLEQFFLEKVAQFYQLTSTLKWFVYFQPLHILYTVLAGFFGQVKTYTWKGRQVK